MSHSWTVLEFQPCTLWAHTEASSFSTKPVVLKDVVPQTSSISITWGPVRNALVGPIRDPLNQKLGVAPGGLCVSKPSRGF